MAQMHFYVPDAFAKEIKKRARDARLPVSRYLGELVKREIGTGWPEDYFEHVIGGWQGEPLRREFEGKFERRLKQ